MMLSDELVQKIETTLAPVNRDLALHQMLGKKGRAAMGALEGYKSTAKLLALEIKGDFGNPERLPQRIAALKNAMVVGLLSLEKKLRDLSAFQDVFEGFDRATVATLADEVKKAINPLLHPIFQHRMKEALADSGTHDPLANFKSAAREAWNGYLDLVLSAAPDPFQLSTAERNLRNEMGQLAGADANHTGDYAELYATIRNATSPNWGVGRDRATTSVGRG